MENQKNKNAQAIAIGFALIFLVGAFTYLRNFSFSKENSTDKQSASNPAKNVTELGTQIVSIQDLNKWINQKAKLEIIDVRSTDEFAAEHIIGSTNIPFDSLQNNLNGLDKNTKTVFLDSDGNPDDQQFFSNFFKTNQLSNFYFLDGGFANWKSQIYPTISAGDFNSFTDRAKVTFIESDKLKELMGQNKNLLLIDVRKSDEFAGGHLKGAINIFMDDLENKRNQIPVGKQIVVYDNDGQWAYKAAVRLFDLGFFNALSLSDGLDTWKKKNYEVVK